MAGLIHGLAQDAVIVVLDTTLGTVADEDGNYHLSLPSGSWQLEFSLIGYATQRQAPVALRSDSDITLHIALQQDAIALREIVVTPGRFAIMGDARGSQQTLSEEEIQSSSARTSTPQPLPPSASSVAPSC